MQNRIIDFRSDTLSIQTVAMKEIMRNASVGDDVFEEDANTNALEEYAAAECRKEAALFTPSGTMANLIAILSHTNRGGEVLTGENSHVFLYEVGGSSVLGGTVFRTFDDNGGKPDVNRIDEKIREDEIYFPKTELICLENTHNLMGGIAYRPEDIVPIREMALKKGLLLHLDGARLFNACILHNREIHEYAQLVDSLMFCFAKGLGAPMGAILIGSKQFIKKARKIRKMLGGGIRQAGYMTACALYALKNNISRLREDNENAKALADGLKGYSLFKIDYMEESTNIVYIWFNHALRVKDYLVEFEKRGIKLLANDKGYRIIMHNAITREDVLHTIEVFKEIFKL